MSNTKTPYNWYVLAVAIVAVVGMALILDWQPNPIIQTRSAVGQAGGFAEDLKVIEVNIAPKPPIAAGKRIQYVEFVVMNSGSGSMNVASKVDGYRSTFYTRFKLIKSNGGTPYNELAKTNRLYFDPSRSTGGWGTGSQSNYYYLASGQVARFGFYPDQSLMPKLSSSYSYTFRVSADPYDNNLIGEKDDPDNTNNIFNKQVDVLSE